MTASSSSSAMAARKRLGSQLRELRLDARLSGRDLATAAGWHGGSKVSKIEHGTRPPSADDIREWCGVCGAPEGRADELIAELRAVESTWLDWKRAERTGLLHMNLQVRSIFEETRLLRAYSCKIIPGLLQTDGYTRAILTAIRDSRGVPIDDVDAAVAERMARKQVLRKGDHRFAFLVEEAVLGYRVGDATMMGDQMAHLLELASLPSVSFGVIPADADRSLRCPAESFTMFDNHQVNVELVSGFLTVTQPAELALYETTFAELVSIAVHGRAARVLVAKAIQALG